MAFPRRRPAAVPFLLFCALAALAGTACRRAEPRPSIVLISIDTLRSDRLPAYGYAPGRTPSIDRLARDGVLFERAFAQVPLTLPSHASLMTGLLPPEHGVRNNVGFSLAAARQPSPSCSSARSRRSPARPVAVPSRGRRSC